MTIKMLRGKLESQGLKSTARESESTEASISEYKMADILKQNIKEKNLQIEELTKRNKLLMYQLEDLNRSSTSQNGTSVGSSLAESTELNQERMIMKLNELSMLLMNEEGEKLRLSE
jgi:hypothetical protein